MSTLSEKYCVNMTDMNQEEFLDYTMADSMPEFFQKKQHFENDDLEQPAS